jgi:hypothetical protein
MEESTMADMSESVIIDTQHSETLPTEEHEQEKPKIKKKKTFWDFNN